MFGYALDQYAFQLGYAQRLLADIDPARMTVQPLPRMNHPAWIIGHLAYVGDMVHKLLGMPLRTPERYGALFAPGTQPVAEAEHYPAKDELLAMLEEVHRVVPDAVRSAPAELWGKPHPVPMEALKLLPTMGNLVTHILTTHEGVHLGQLSMWRRTQGLPPLF